MRVLNLYAGVGGNRKLWDGVEVTAVEYNEKIADIYQALYPDDTVIRADAHDYLLHHHDEFDFVWSSPPCQTHTRMVKATRHKKRRYPDMKLYEEILYLEHNRKAPWVVENVAPYYGGMRKYTQVGRHLFWSNMALQGIIDQPRPPNFINLCNTEGAQKMKDWLGIQYEKNVYYEGNHCPAQVLRNCVHPEIGKQVLDRATRSRQA